MKKKPRILVVGSLAMDLSCSTPRFPQSGETVIGLNFTTAPGGKGANQAVQAARLGAQVTMVGKIGNDAFGRQVKASLENAGVDTGRLGVSEDRPTGIADIQLEVTEEGTANRILVIPGANHAITAADVSSLEPTIRDYDMVILQLEIPLEINLLVAQMAHANQVPVMLNSAPSAPLPDELLRCLTYLSPNEHEASDLTGIAVRDPQSAQRAVAYFMEKGVQNVLITLGSQGAVYGNRELFVSSPCANYGYVADSTAAGDSFIGAFCTAMCLGVSCETALRFANHTAAITVSRLGAQPSLPTITEVLDFMREQGHSTAEFACLV